jgi:antirestriction protein ArdC
MFLAAERGIPHNPEQHAAYVGHWINKWRARHLLINREDEIM